MKYVTWKAATTRTGPNNAWHIIWAISKFFLFLFLVSLILTTIYRWKIVTWKTATTRTGPNNMSCIVWAVYKPVPSWTAPGSEGGDDRAGMLPPPPSPLLLEKAWGTNAPQAFGMFSFFYISPPPGEGSYPCGWHTNINWHLDCSRKAFIPNIISMLS